ncbi:hypothetical protein B5F14_01730 [Faecalitalea cylindroides]|uniref:Uncharacterized protein n=1 Tax=Faecalitalea cylindroides TaxID=39483 RepID=A0A1Y4M4S2_9FIRM|nr:hypothetical protein [Faecalitalea cylindroides]OUP61702.1 hypothetical protein B5F14_01730 [Faecalitalea cylindroides]
MIKLNEIQAKYGEYLVDEEKLKDLLVKPKPKTVWDLKDGDEYWHISTINNNNYATWNGNAWDLAIRENGNAFLTYDEAKFELERRKCEAIMLKYGRRLFKYKQNNFFIKYDHRNDCIGIEYWIEIQYQGTIYFDSEELAQKAIDEIGEERLKKYVFRVEE